MATNECRSKRSKDKWKRNRHNWKRERVYLRCDGKKKPEMSLKSKRRLLNKDADRSNALKRVHYIEKLKSWNRIAKVLQYITNILHIHCKIFTSYKYVCNAFAMPYFLHSNKVEKIKQLWKRKQLLCHILTFSIELASPGYSGFEVVKIHFITWLTGIF